VDDQLAGVDRAGEVLLEGGASAGGLGHSVGVDDHAVLALGLGQVHREVGVAEQRVGVAVAGVGGGGDPDTGADRDRSAVQGDRHGQAGQDALGDTAGGIGTTVDHERELVTADAGDDVARADAAAQSLGEGHQQLVALGVAPAVVDVLEVVDVHEQDADRGTALENAVGDLLEQGAVGQAGQRVAEHLVLVQPPGREVSQARREHEDGVDARPHPRIAVGRAVREDLFGVDGADDPVVQRHGEDRDAVGDPVLVERDDADHHEEDEVRLGDAAPQVHEGRGGGHQADGGGRRARLAAQPLGDGEGDRAGDDQQHGDDGRLAEAAQPGEEHQREGRDQREPDDGPVPALPDVLGQQPTLGQHTCHPVAESAHHRWPIGAGGRFLERAAIECPRRG
jgi:hypothetical protein